MVMFDTVNLWLPIDKAGNFDLSKTLQKLSGLSETTKDDGQVYYSGHLNNYKVFLSGQGVSLKGSLAKYFLPDNFHTMTRSDSARALEQLSDELYLPIHNSNVSRFDFAQNFLMDYEPEAYYPFLGQCQYYKRFPQDKSLYYTNGMRQKVFYNKIAEGKAKRLSLPEVWNGQNVLRYEMRFISRLPKQFKQAEIKASSLSNEKFYIIIFDRWFAEYEAINKNHSINFNLSDMKSPKDFRKQLELFAIKMIGQDKIMQEIENLKHQKAFKHDKYYNRLSDEIKELCKTPEMTNQSDLVAELDRKIKAAKSHYR